MNLMYFIFMAVGIFIFVLGFILYKYKAIEMLSGYDPTKKYDREGLAKFNGSNLMYMGGSIALINVIFVAISKSHTIASILDIIIFFVDVIYFSLKCAIYSKRYELSEGTEKSKAQKYYNKTSIIAVSVLLIIVFGLIGGFMIEESLQSTTLSVDNKELNIKAGAVERFYDTKSINKIYINNTIPDHSKSSGEGIGSIERGTYDVNGLGKGSIFLESEKGPYLYVIMGKDFVIINNKDASKTKKFYKELLKYKNNGGDLK